MMPYDADFLGGMQRRPVDPSRGPHADGPPLDRRLFLALGLASCCGCAAPLLRGQTPEPEWTEEKKFELVGDFARPWGLNWVKLEAVGLVANLDNTGSDPPPSPQRQMLIGEMQSHDVKDPDKVLASPTTSMVIVRAYLPPGVQKGDPLDLEVRVPSRSETTSLRGGWLLPARLRQMEVLGGSVRMGNIDGLGQGDVLVDAVFEATSDRVPETRGRILGGGVSLLSRELGLAISKNDASIRVSTQIGRAINQRFFTVDAGVKKGVANPERDNYLALAVSPRYKHNLARYLRVIRNIPLRESPTERIERLKLLEKKLLEPASCVLASLQLEAIGNEAIPALQEGLKSSDREVRFYSAEALAYLDRPEAAAVLAAAAKDEPAFRWHALTALSTLTHVAALDGLTDLLHVPSVETRYGAFRALRTRNANDPTTKGEVLEGRFRYHAIATTGEPLIHATRSRAPEIVVFGHEQRLKDVKVLSAGKRIMITRLETGELRAGRYDPGQETVYETFAPEVDKLIRTIAMLGGNSSDVIQCLQEAKRAGVLEARLAVEAVPRPNRKFYRDDDPLPEAPEGEPADEGEASSLAANPAATPAPELFRDGLAGQTENDSRGTSKANLNEPYVAPGYEPKRGSLFDTLNPFKESSKSE
jgi:flagellar basal body P-ring protein FlgI